MPLSNDREIATKGYWYINSYKVKADQVIYKGAFVNIDSNGYLKIASDTVGERFAGISTDRVNTMGISDGSYTCNVGFIQQIAIYKTGLVLTDIGKMFYGISDSNVSSSATNINPCGQCIGIDLERSLITLLLNIGFERPVSAGIIIASGASITVEDGASIVIEPGAALSMNGELLIGNPLTPASLTGNTNNWNLDFDNYNIIRASSTLGVDLTGIVAPSPARGKILHFFNVGSNEIKIMNASGSSAAVNRFLLQNDIAIKADESIILVYDPVDTRWRATGTIAQV